MAKSCQAGDIVHFRKSGHWPLGRIEAVYPGAEDCVRIVDVRMNQMLYCRSIQCLVPIAKRANFPRLSGQQIDHNGVRPAAQSARLLAHQYSYSLLVVLCSMTTFFFSCCLAVTAMCLLSFVSLDCMAQSHDEGGDDLMS